MNAIQAYKHYYIDRDHEQVDLFRLLKNEYGIEKIIYPGSYIHISPSFIFSDVVYIDSDKNAKMYFQSNDLIHLVNTKKEYPEDPKIVFFGLIFLNDKEGDLILPLCLFVNFICQL
jgi:pyoverdine/dityrosine biosynthesis protein Dit1